MPTILSAKDIAEESLKKIGRFPTSQAQANAVDLSRALRGLELVLNDFAGQASAIGAKGTLQLPLLASIASYPLNQLNNPAGVQLVTDAELIQIASGASSPLKIVSEEEFFKLNLRETGPPCHIYINKGPEASPTLQMHPTLGAEVPAQTYKLLLQVQTYTTHIPTKGNNTPLVNIRPSWYLWAITKLAYHLGTGTIRRLPKQETDDLKRDYEEMETKLNGFDGGDNSNQPFTESWGQ